MKFTYFQKARFLIFIFNYPFQTIHFKFIIVRFHLNFLIKKVAHLFLIFQQSPFLNFQIRFLLDFHSIQLIMNNRIPTPLKKFRIKINFFETFSMLPIRDFLTNLKSSKFLILAPPNFPKDSHFLNLQLIGLLIT